jgi:hypothetical protein
VNVTVPLSAQSEKQAVGASSTPFATLDSAKLYEYVSTVDTWVAQGATPTAAAASGSLFVAAKRVLLVHGGYGAVLAQIQDAGAGVATLTPLAIMGV